ncbi:putative membrane protein YfhO [Lactobacillus colini]|uniref:Membrane protein YfhO n=1 Tax=Lactobacillus colini TaxID=1819254 RepID=A0ABS4MB07_9LACO|nr:YfhO family protein [Lactobacillus colini]MBP2056861.1 putative membrane protein YfhO [Lactobacillus colini]
MSKTRQKILFILSFLLPSIIFFSYFAYRGLEILTVDLGQQYVDFLAYYRDNLFTNPLKLIYSLAKGLGGSMIGTDAYYLNSPLNLILFLFPKKLLPEAILGLISIKIGLIGLSSYYIWQKLFTNYHKTIALAASLAYALCGYVIANNLNLMWLDTLILLPLLINCINQILTSQNSKWLILVTFLLWFTNFYTGFMALLFGLLYFIVQLFSKRYVHPANLIKIYLTKSIIASFLVSFILVPTFFELLQGKVHGSSNFNFKFQFLPWNIFNKFEIGSYNFNEMESGMPNIYFTSLLLLICLTYFLSNKVAIRAKIANFILLIFLCLSFSFNPLVLLWHMGQFPVWYPGRFSFVFVFFALNLTIQVLSQQESFSLFQKLLTIIVAISLSGFFYLNYERYSFMDQTKLELSLIFIICDLLLIIFYRYKWAPIFILGLAGIEVVVNLMFSLDNITYQHNYSYTNTTQAFKQASHYVNTHNTSLFRIEKNFDRSENDALSQDYNGVGHFNSISDWQTLQFIDKIGLKNNDNSFSNAYSTLATDAILGIKYYFIPAPGFRTLPIKQQINLTEVYWRPDLDKDKIIKQSKQVQIRKNDAALPLIFKLNSAKGLSLKSGDPVGNQTRILQNILGTKQKFFTAFDLPDNPEVHNVDAWPGGWRQYDRINKNKDSTISFVFKPNTNDPYYFELPSDVDSDSASMYVNGNSVDTENLGTSSKLINFASNSKGQTIHINFILHTSSINLTNAKIWRLNTTKLQSALKDYNKDQPVTYQTSPLSLKLTVNNSNNSNQRLASTIPFSNNWLIFDNGHLVKKQLWASTFLSFKLRPGIHHINLIYIPFAFLTGLLISIVVLILLVIIHRKNRPHEK